MALYMYVRLSADGKELLAPACPYGCQPLARRRDPSKQIVHRHAAAGGLGHRYGHCNPALGHPGYELTDRPELHGLPVPEEGATP